MTPLRLFVIFGLLYVGWRLLRRDLHNQGRTKSSAEENGAACSSEVEDTLVEDPVCHVLVPKRQALRYRKDGVTYYFCSEQCCDQFAGQPEEGES